MSARITFESSEEAMSTATATPNLPNLQELEAQLRGLEVKRDVKNLVGSGSVRSTR
jgi:hypothetical protein